MEKKIILLINGSQVLMDITKKILERVGYSVRCAVGIAGAREQLMDFIPDGIILDNELPDGKGIDYCRELRRESTVPIIILSNTKEDELDALQAGANDFLKKPFDYEIMKVRIGIMLNTKVDISSVTDDEKNTEYSMETFAKSKTAEQAQYQYAAQSNTEDKLIKKKRLLKFKYFYTVAAACFVFVILGITIFPMFYNNPEYIEMSEEPIPLAGFTFPTEENITDNGAEQEIKFPDIDNITIPVDSTEAEMILLNPEENPCYLTFEIFLKDTEESLYLSDMVAPGAYIESITISRGLAKGKYNAAIKIYAYALEDFTAMSVTTIEFYITAI